MPTIVRDRYFGFSNAPDEKGLAFPDERRITVAVDLMMTCLSRAGTEVLVLKTRLHCTTWIADRSAAFSRADHQEKKAASTARQMAW
ncbi:MAG: hypothetical protein ABSF43_15040 [Rectinemataceae bacterium]